MRDNLVSIVDCFIQQEKINFSLSKDTPFEFWLDDPLETVTVRFKIDAPSKEIFYDVYSPKYSLHLKEETIDDVKRLEYLAEEHRQWKIAEIIENIWLILDQIRMWAVKNNFRLIEKNLV